MQLINTLFVSESNFLTKNKTEQVIQNFPRSGFVFSLENQKSFQRILITDPRGFSFYISKENFFNLLQSLSLEDFSLAQMDIIIDGSNFHLLRVSDPIYIDLQFQERLSLKDCINKRLTFFYQKKKTNAIYLGEKQFLLAMFKNLNKEVNKQEFETFQKIKHFLPDFFKNTKAYSSFSKFFDEKIEKRHVFYVEEFNYFIFIDKKVEIISVEDSSCNIDALSIYQEMISSYLYLKMEGVPSFIKIRTSKEGYYPFILRDEEVNIEEEKELLTELFFSDFYSESNDIFSIDNFKACQELNVSPVYLFENFQFNNAEYSDYILSKIYEMAIYFAPYQNRVNFMVGKTIKDEMRFAIFLLESENQRDTISLVNIFYKIKNQHRGMFGFHGRIENYVLEILEAICVGEYSKYFK